MDSEKSKKDWYELYLSEKAKYWRERLYMTETALLKLIPHVLEKDTDEYFDMEELLYELPVPATEEEVDSLATAAKMLVVYYMIKDYLFSWYDTEFLHAEHVKSFVHNDEVKEQIEEEVFVLAGRITAQYSYSQIHKILSSEEDFEDIFPIEVFTGESPIRNPLLLTKDTMRDLLAPLFKKRHPEAYKKEEEWRSIAAAEDVSSEMDESDYRIIRPEFIPSYQYLEQYLDDYYDDYEQSRPFSWDYEYVKPFMDHFRNMDEDALQMLSDLLFYKNDNGEYCKYTIEDLKQEREADCISTRLVNSIANARGYYFVPYYYDFKILDKLSDLFGYKDDTYTFFNQLKSIWRVSK